MNKAALEAALGDVLQPIGFKKKGGAWYRSSSEVLQGVELQKSSYGGQFFVNLFFVPEGHLVDGMPTPKEHKCPIRIRLSAALSDRGGRVDELFDLERSALGDSDRAIGIRELLQKDLLPWLAELQSTEGLKAGIVRGDFKRGAVNLAVQRLLGIAPSSASTA
jgi:Domain of unknown function (DUF4304)